MYDSGYHTHSWVAAVLRCRETSPCACEGLALVLSGLKATEGKQSCTLCAWLPADMTFGGVISEYFHR
jgi:hypothetical protein